MEILSYEEIDSSLHGTSCKVYCIHAKVSKIYECAQEMIATISDTSWINKLGPVPKKTLYFPVKKAQCLNLTFPKECQELMFMI